ncbi:hypothetical protein BS47DRAFT_1404191 [Hydnum rufescens UP504]|uniref:PAN2-PAN3 deadenylation complex catalytic subunit PAN2 n=1 Tax=Hydnum rufescens UP504 TaxID=1448309 RepID=A0A9P6BB21_9AGAM|nr:hypothetical protein BS47DRAFT_1404191 [Hydnum rufescens UP504]
MSTYHSLPPFGQPPYPQPITSLSFDPVSDALWAGHASGIVSAYHGASRMRGVTYIVGKGDPVKRVLASDGYVTACTSLGVGVWGKGGVNKWYHHFCWFNDIFTSSYKTPYPDYLPARPEFLVMNSAGTLIRTYPAPPMITHLRASHSILLSGGSDGYLRTHDLRLGSRGEQDVPESSVLAHVGGIQGLEVSGNYAVTIGWGMRQSRPHPDPLVKLFDLRTMRPLPPLPFSSGPAFINAHSKQSNTITITSAQGLVHTLDITRPNDGGEFYQIDVPSYISSVAVSPSGAYIAFGDAEGTIHLLTSTSSEEHVPFNGFDGKPVEWADPPQSLPDIEWDDSTPLNRVGMPYYDQDLLSSYTVPLIPSTMECPPPPKIPPQVLTAVKTQEFLQYAIVPKELRGKRNVVETQPRRKDEGRFRSDQGSRVGDALLSPTTPEILHPEVPKSYRRVGIKYSKFGVEDFDFGFYNKTTYSGLETDIPNSYANSLVQLLHYALPVRRLAKSHITTVCRTEHCLLCELGFVVRMLEDARGINLQARNFCVTVGRKQTGAIECQLLGMIQQLNRFTLEEFSVEGNTFPHNPYIILPPGGISSTNPAAAPITQLLGVDAKTVTVCTNCGFKRDKDLMSHVVDLIYPRRLVNDSAVGCDIDFAAILHASLERDITYKSTCQKCKHLSNHRSRRALSSEHMPPILAVNAAVNNEDHLNFWLDNKASTGSFLKSKVRVEMRSAEGELYHGSAESVTYDLRGYIAEVRMGKANHLIAIVKKLSSPSIDETPSSPWYIFNDFVVRNIPEEEALSFPGKWKVPCVVYLERIDMMNQLDFSALPQELDPAILGQRISMATHVDWNSIKHEPLRLDELPKPGTFIAIDAEFVALQQEESEFRSDGTKKVLKPSQLSLARVSVLRGDGPKAGVPFIDDYIHTSDIIVDYLTEYSGIKYGDLQPNSSAHVLLPLKVVYKKLRLLVDLGCIFVGHGLSKDFRIINIFVPPERVIDTVDLYYVKERHRRLSLRFLSYYVLKQHIQIDTHDSIEDARAALLLYEEYIKHESQGTFDDLLKDIYNEGKRLVCWFTQFGPFLSYQSRSSNGRSPSRHLPNLHK